MESVKETMATYSKSNKIEYSKKLKYAFYKKILILIFILSSTHCDLEQHPVKQGKQIQHAIKTPKVLLIGFDGATWKELSPAIKKGLMPHLSLLIQQGVSAPLKTIKPTMTPVVWTSIASGKMPVKHGITSIILRDPITHERKPLISTVVKVKRIWDILTDYNKSSCIIRWPVTWPASQINGIMISEFAFQTNRLNRTYPSQPEIIVDQNSVDFKLKDIETLTGINEEKYAALKPEWQWKLYCILREYNLDIWFHEIAKDLLPKGQKDLTAVYYYSMDAIGHSFYKFNEQSNIDSSDPDFADIIPSWCWLYDQFLGDLLSCVDPDTYIIICSDHGMELAGQPQNFLIKSIDRPATDPNSVEKSPDTPPGPPFDTDPFAVKLQYTFPTGQHINAPDGIFVISGPGIKQNISLNEVHVCDITPTLLYLMGLPIAEDFDGHVKTDLFTDTYLKSHPLKKITSFENSSSGNRMISLSSDSYKNEDSMLLNRLKAMGYIQ